MNKITIASWSVFSILVLTIGAAWIWSSAAPFSNTTQGYIPAPQEGFLAPDFRLETFGGDRYTLSDLRGKPVLINFWASWCPPCRSEMPAIQNVFDEFQDQGFVVLAVIMVPVIIEAARRVGYSPKSARFIASRLIRNPVVRAMMRDLCKRYNLGYWGR